MEDFEFKTKVITDLAVIKNELGHIKKDMPNKNVETKVKTNRWLIGIMYGTYIPLIITILIMYNQRRAIGHVELVSNSKETKSVQIQ